MRLALLILALVPLILALGPHAARAGSFPRSVKVKMIASTGDAKLYRAKDIIGIGESVTARDVANVLGRWTTYKEWDSIGELKQMDKLFNDDGTEKVKLKGQQSEALLAPRPGNGDWVKKTPQRRGFCLRRGLVQRYWHTENVGLLKFKSKALADSVGSTVAEMNRLPINPAATDVVWDALSRSNSGFIDKEVIDDRRAAFVAPDGSFDLAAFRGDLARAKVTVIQAWCIFPGSIIATQLGIFLKLNGPESAAEYLSASQGMLGDNGAMWAEAFGFK